MRCFHQRGGEQDDQAILNHVKIEPLKAGARVIPAMIQVGSRLSWRVGLLLALPFFIALGWAESHWPIAPAGVSPINAGTAILQFALFYLAVFSLYTVLRSIVSCHTAFWAALFMGLNPWFLHSLGTAPGMSLAGALGALALSAWTAKAQRWHVLMVLAGIVFSASVKVHVFSLTYLPVLFFTFLYMNHVRHKHPLYRVSALFVAGFALGGVFMFDGSTLSQGLMLQMTGGPHNDFAETLNLAQLPSTFYLHILTALWLLSAVLLFQAKNKKGYSGFAAIGSDPAMRPYGFCLSLCFSYGLFILTMEGGLGFSLLAFSSLSGFCIPLACIGLAGVLERGGLTDERRHRHTAMLFLISLTLVSYPALQSQLMNIFSDHYLWVHLGLWIACLAILWQLPTIQKMKVGRAAVIALVLLAGFFLTGHNNPVWKKGGSPDPSPQLTQAIEKSYE